MKPATQSSGTGFSGLVLEMILCPACLGAGDIGIPDEIKAAYPDYDFDGCPDCDGSGNVMVRPHVAEDERRIAREYPRLGRGDVHGRRGRVGWN